MDYMRQPGERWEFKANTDHFVVEALSEPQGAAKIIYLYSDHSGWGRTLGQQLDTPSWNKSDYSYQHGCWKHLPGQQTPEKDKV